MGFPARTSPYYQTGVYYVFASSGNKFYTTFVCVISVRLTGIQPQKYVALSMLSSYSSCNIHLILKGFVGPIYSTLDPTVRSNICYDVNLDEFIINQER